MARAPRHISPGVAYHLISQFVDRDWFIATAAEREQYLKLLGRALTTSDWCCLAYAVMSNHIHLVAIAGRQSLASWIRRAHSDFAGWMNARYDRIGPLFVRGPKDIAIPPIRVANVMAYVHNNPVRAGVVPVPASSDWTSHRAYLGLARAPAWLHVDTGLACAGFRDPEPFDQWVIEHSTDGRDDLVHEESKTSAREYALNTSAPPTSKGVDAASIVRATADELDVSLRRVCSRRKGDVEIRARQIAVQCAVDSGLTCSAIADALGISQQGVSHIIQRQALPGVREASDRVLRRLGVPEATRHTLSTDHASRFAVELTTVGDRAAIGVGDAPF